jgi:hypothetical protein
MGSIYWFERKHKVHEAKINIEQHKTKLMTQEKITIASGK